MAEQRGPAAAAPATEEPAAEGAEGGTLSRFLRPRYVFPTLLAVIALIIFLTPAAVGRGGDPRLTSRSTEPQGARAFRELASRFGWRTSERVIPLTARVGARRPLPPLDTAAVYAVLDPPIDLTAAEAGALLQAVRRGAGLLVVLRRGATLADSLALRPSRAGAPAAEVTGPDAAGRCPAGSSKRGGIDWPGGRVYSYWLHPTGPLPRGTVGLVALKRAGAQPPNAAGSAGDAEDDDEVADDEDDEAASDSDSAAHVGARIDTVKLVDLDSAGNDGRTNRWAAVGFPLDAGRVVVVADPDWLRNDVVRVCEWNAGVHAVRMLEYLSHGRAGGRAALVFDEYHQGHGRHPSTLRSIRRALTSDPWGRALAQALVAGLVLVAALGVRAVAPRPTARFARRSPLEHVGALARAYEQIGATRLATRRLVRGLRRRHGTWGTGLAGAPRAGTRGGGESDDAFLGAVAERFPAVAADVALLREAEGASRSPEQFLEVGRAVERVERALAAGPARR